MRKLTIPRKIWLRGEGDGTGQLHREEDGKECCVGIYLRACGVHVAILKDKEVALGVPVGSISDEARWLIDAGHKDSEGKTEYTTPGDVQDLYAINDEALAWADEGDDDGNRIPALARPEKEAKLREEKIAAIFAKHDVQVEFTD